MRGARLSDALFVNGRVMTMDPGAPAAEAVAVRDGRILAVGDAAEVGSLLAPGAITVDLGGAVLLPGFHDSHLHLTEHGFVLDRLDLSGAGNLAEALELVAARARELPAGEPLLGSGFSLARWGLGGVSREDLDRAAPGRVVVLRSQDHHSAWLSTPALELAGITAGTPDPEGGTIVRDGTGAPTGLLLERAARLGVEALPAPTPERVRAALELAGRDLAARGVTTVHHMAAEAPGYWREMALLASRGPYPLRVWACVDQEKVEHAAELGLATGVGGDDFVVGGAKFFVDGALGSRTAWMLEPYADGSGVGTAVHGPAVLAERLPVALRAGFVPVVHAIGDAANRAALDAFEATRPLWEGRWRPRLEHAQHLTPEDAARVGALGVVASMQPIHLTFDVGIISELLPDRLERVYAFRSLVRGGAALALGSDAPIAPPDVFAGVRAACERADLGGRELPRGEELSVEEALAGYTRGAAAAIQREDRSGMLRAGFDADLVALSGLPGAGDAAPEVLVTVKGGAVTHDAGVLRFD